MEKRKIGIIAGGGELPIVSAKKANEEGYDVFVSGWKGVTSGKLKSFSKNIKLFPLGELRGVIDYFKSEGVEQVIVVGKVEPSSLWRINPFDETVKSFLKDFFKKKPLRILEEFGNLLLKEGIEVIDSTLFLKELMPDAGIYSGSIDESEESMLEEAFLTAKKIADLDIGQSIAVKEGMIVAVEAIEGTDMMIKRAGKYTNGGFFLIKVSRTRQDNRYDVPVVGEKTVKLLKKCGAKGIVFEAKRTIFLQFEKAIDFSRKNNLVVRAL